MKMLTAAQWCEVLVKCGAKPLTAAKWSPIFADVIETDTFSRGHAEVDDFLGQVLHESGMLEKLEEGLYYKTPGRLMTIWPTRFKSLSDELPYLRNPEALANKVYGGRAEFMQVITDMREAVREQRVEIKELQKSVNAITTDTALIRGRLAGGDTPAGQRK
jgi:hypothetical protein